MALIDQINTAFTRVGTEFKTVYSRIGNLANATTTAKGDVISMINELNAKPSGTGGASINDAAASGTTTYSSNKINTLDAAKADANAVVNLTTAQTVAGVKTFSSAPVVPDASFTTAKVTGLDTALTGKAAASHTHTAAQVTDFTTAAVAAVILDSAAITDTSKTWSAKKTNDQIEARAAAIVASSPAQLDTLNELSAALGNDANFAATTSTALGNRLKVDGTPQTITSANATVARDNIGAQSAADIGNVNTNFALTFTNALV